ncbi:RBBP9/YdeN family alpha/beta hydrolase [Aquimarina sediminis]|uniref:RBBP9/YdeN family alpha/beta hydrolase n=1 Tax=Aquimarina sediminis TaxID=2070536 RepID=UPI000CA08E56|nr:alpha/beta hydrolase [Aquimarina sediminis]
MVNKHKIYVIHGYTASAEANWYSYLKNELDNEKVEVIVLDMPNSHKPILKEWIDHIEKSIGLYDQNSIFIGHSLGCVTILNYLNSKEIKGLFLISGFVEKTPITELEEFILPKLNYDKIKKLTINRMVITAKDDDIVPYYYSQTLAERLEAQCILLDEGKHFIDRDGYTTFPYLVQEIKKII